MAAFWNNDIHDEGLNLIRTETTHLYICSAMPATYAEATDTYALGYRENPTIGNPEDSTDPAGRKVVVGAISDGTVTDSGEATHKCLVDDVNNRLLVAQALGTGQQVTQGNPFTLTAFDVTYPDPVE